MNNEELESLLRPSQPLNIRGNNIRGQSNLDNELLLRDPELLQTLRRIGQRNRDMSRQVEQMNQELARRRQRESNRMNNSTILPYTNWSIEESAQEVERQKLKIPKKRAPVPVRERSPTKEQKQAISTPLFSGSDIATSTEIQLYDPQFAKKQANTWQIEPLRPTRLYAPYNKWWLGGRSMQGYGNRKKYNKFNYVPMYTAFNNKYTRWNLGGFAPNSAIHTDHFTVNHRGLRPANIYAELINRKI